MTSGRLLPGLTAQRLLTATPAARPLNKTTSAETADNAGTPQLKQFLMVSIKEFPRGINSDQVISGASATARVQRASWSGPSVRPRAQGHKLQAASIKLQAPSSLSNKLQASSPVAKASSFKPQASSAKTPDPGKSFKHPEPRCWTKIKLLRGCLMWKAI